MKQVAFLFTVILFSTFFIVSHSRKVSADLAINTLSKYTGFVGDQVELIGEIITVNGTYEILFDGIPIKSANATLNSVQDRFSVPNGTSGDHMIRLRDVSNVTESAALNFTIQTQYAIRAIVPEEPRQLQQGENITLLTEITGGNASRTYRASISVVDPSNVNYSSGELIIQINSSGYGSTIITYPEELHNGQPHTFYTGIYNLFLLDRNNESLAVEDFYIGLTDASEYHRFQTVSVKAANYTFPSDIVEVVITHNETAVFRSPEINGSQTGGVVTTEWIIPANATLGSYNVEVILKRPIGTIKTVEDTQDFTIVTKAFSCEVKTYNLDGEPVEGVLVEAYNLTSVRVHGIPIADAQTTDENGSAFFFLEATNYTFRAFWNASNASKALVGKSSWKSLGKPPGNLTGEYAVDLTCNLATLRIATKDVYGKTLPFVGVNMSFTYIQRLNFTDAGTLSTETNMSGIAGFENMFTTINQVNINYTISVSRYDHVFESKTVNLTDSKWINFTFPEYELIVNVFDRAGSTLEDVRVKIYEWNTGANADDDWSQQGMTDADGIIRFNSVFGKYGVLVFAGDSLINETAVNLVVDPTSFQVQSRLYPLLLTVNIIDYFGQGIAGVNVTLEHEDFTSSAKTNGGGTAIFDQLPGGKYRILAHISGKPYEIYDLNLREPSEVVLRIDRLVSIGGMLTETSYLTSIILLSVMVVFTLLLYSYRLLRNRRREE